MPRLSDTMEEGTILRWLANDGDHVRRGQELVEIETDKATMVYESDQDGMLRTVAREGQTLAVGEPIAQVGQSGHDSSAAQAAAGQAALSHGEAPPAAAPAAADGPSSAVTASRAPGDQQAGSDEAARVKASPLARRMASERGLDLRALQGSGPGGRIVKADVQSAAPADREAQSSAGSGQRTCAGERTGAGGRVAAGGGDAGAGAVSAGAPAARGGELAAAKGQARELELTRTQQVIARRMAESKATIPHFTLSLDVDMDQCASLREQLKGVAPAGELVPTYNDMVVKACALALRAHPRANSSYRDGRLALHSRVNVGVAVASEDQDSGGALIVPTVFDADRKALGEIARETRALAQRVRDGSITPPELSGGTFTVSNLGMYGVRSFTAIINPPQAAILSVGAVAPRAVVRDGGIGVSREMSLVLACDHRVLYGADAARFLAHIRQLLERPASLAL